MGVFVKHIFANGASDHSGQNREFAKAAKEYIDIGWQVQTKNHQEIYMKMLPFDPNGDETLGPCIIPRGAQMYVNIGKVRVDDSVDSRRNEKVYWEMLEGEFDPNVTWDTRPSDSAGTILQTEWFGGDPSLSYSGTGIGTADGQWHFVTHDATMMQKIMKAENVYLRFRPDPQSISASYFVVNYNASYLDYDLKPEVAATVTDVSTGDGIYDKLYFNVFDVTREQLDCDEEIRWRCAYWTTFQEYKVSKFLLKYSTDDGESWETAYETTNVNSEEDSGDFVLPANSLPAANKITISLEVYMSHSLYNAVGHWERNYKTVSSRPKVKILTPIQVYVEGTEPLIMRWQYEGAYTQARYTVQYTLDAPTSTTRTWYTLASTTSSASTYTIPANSLPGGNVWLSVTVQDTQGKTAMDTSSIVVSATPRVTNVRITPSTSAPRITVGWDCSDQEAAQVRIDNGTTYDSGILFGKDKTHTPDVWLSNGSHTVSVRAQNRLGFWSPWANVTISTSNSGGAAITLSAVTVGQSINLSWVTTGNYSQYIVMRDGVKIGTTKAKAYSDYYTAGTHTYRVRGLMTYTYTDSNNASATLYTAKAQIAAIVDSGVPTWIQLWLGTDPERAVNRSVAQTVAYTHYSGRDWPVAEVSEYRDETYSVTVALTNAADQKNFEALLGREVCYKRRNQAVIGLLDAYTARHTRSKNIVEYACTIRRVDDEEDVI